MPGIHPKEQEQISQPVPQALDTATRYGFDVSGIIQPQGMYRAIHDRGLQPTYFGDEEKDPMKRQCPTGGCSSDKSLYRDIYEDLFTQEVARKPTVNLQDKAQRREVHMRVADILRPQVRENRTFLKQDKEGPPVAEGPEFIIKDGGVYYPGFGKSLQQMYKDQQRLRPHEYDPDEHATMTLAEKALVNGAKKVSHVSHNKDEQGNEAIRDQITMVWDEEAQRGRMIIENIAQGGRSLTLKEAQEAMQKKSSGTTEVHPVDGVFIFADKPLAREETQRVVASYGLVKAHNGSIDEPARIFREDVRANQYIRDAIAQEIEAQFPRQDEKTRIFDHVITETIHTAEHVRKSLQQEFEILTTSLRLNTDQEVKTPPIILPQFLQRLLGISEERNREISDRQSQESPEALQKTLEEMKSAQKVIAFAVDPDTQGVAIPAALFALDILVHPIEELPVQEVTVNQSIDLQWREEPFILDANTTEAAVAFFSSAGDEPLLIEMKEKAEQPSPLEHVDMAALRWVKELIQRIDDEPVKKTIETIEHEEEVALLQMAELWEVLVDRNNKIHTVPIKENVCLETAEHKHVEQLSFAVAVWILLKLDGYCRSLRSLKTFIGGETRHSSLIEKLKEHMPEGLVQREPSQWILLAIIWHLAMIREQGLPISNIKYQISKTQSKKSKKKYETQLSQSAVIFAFAS